MQGSFLNKLKECINPLLSLNAFLVFQSLEREKVECSPRVHHYLLGTISVSLVYIIVIYSKKMILHTEPASIPS